MFEKHRHRAALAAVVGCLVLAGAAQVARANETDQFTLPRREDFADVGPLFSRDTYFHLAGVVEKTNNKIAEALLITDARERDAKIEHLRSPGRLADEVRGTYLPGFFDMMKVEDDLRSESVRKLFPGKITAYRTVNWIYRDVHLPFDPRKAVLLFQSSSIDMYGVILGVDKIGHFHDLGHFYFKDYLSARARGESEEKALKRVVNNYANGLISENAAIGSWATGVAANGDLAANYAGYKFYRNLTEAVNLPGGRVEPLIVRKGNFLALNTHVGPDTDFIKPFITNHMNEALNPCRYEWSMHGVIRSRLRKNASEIRTFYCDEQGNPRPKSWFENTAKELSTYGGEDYGHTRFDEEITIAAQCFASDEPDAKMVTHVPPPWPTESSTSTTPSPALPASERVARSGEAGH